MESSTVRVLVALVKAERKRAAALENVAEFLKKRKEQSDALFTQDKEEIEEARKKLAEAEHVGVLGTGLSRLSCLRPTAWLRQRAGTAQLQQQQLKTLARRTTPRPTRGWPH